MMARGIADTLSFVDIYIHLKKTQPELQINSAQTAKNIYKEAIKKIKILLLKKDQNISEILDVLENFSE